MKTSKISPYALCIIAIIAFQSCQKEDTAFPEEIPNDIICNLPAKKYKMDEYVKKTILSEESRTSPIMVTKKNVEKR